MENQILQHDHDLNYTIEELEFWINQQIDSLERQAKRDKWKSALCFAGTFFIPGARKLRIQAGTRRFNINPPI